MKKVSKELKAYLKKMGVATTEERRKFLFPRLCDHHPSYLLEGIEESVERLINALKSRYNIMIWGHADLDGIAASSLLKLALEELGSCEVRVRIPSRSEEGFGLNISDLERFKDQGGDMVVTVDVGITNLAEVEDAKRMGLEVIVTDHHERVDQPPQTVVVDPKAFQDSYPWRELSGAGVVLKLVSALYERMAGLDVTELGKLRPHYWILAALGTVSDRCPLVNENRLIVKLGLEHLRAGRWASLEVWLEEMGVDAESLSVFDLYSKAISAFYAADPEEGVKIMLSHDVQWARERYCELNEQAKRWRQGKQEMISKAESQVRYVGGMAVSAPADIDSDYLGTAAHALRERHELPAMIMAPQGELWHAECRGMEGVDLLQHLSKFRELYKTFGGHRRACGFTLKPGTKERFLEKLDSNPFKKPSSQDEEEFIIELDLEADFSEWSLLAPFGEGNPSPHLLSRNVRLERTESGYHADGVEIYIPFSLRPLPAAEGVYDLHYTVNADGGVRALLLEPASGE